MDLSDKESRSDPPTDISLSSSSNDNVEPEAFESPVESCSSRFATYTTVTIHSKQKV